MKIRKSLIIFIILIITLLCIPNTVNAEEQEYDYEHNGVTLAYIITSDTEKTVSVKVCRETTESGIDVVIPSTIEIEGEDYTVTSIEYNAFYIPLNSIVIPETVTEIKDYAFYNTGLTQVTIPDSVTKIGQRAFPDNIKIMNSYPSSAARKICSRTCIIWNHV